MLPTTMVKCLRWGFAGCVNNRCFPFKGLHNVFGMVLYYHIISHGSPHMHQMIKSATAGDTYVPDTHIMTHVACQLAM
jgi:hypothetical protein